MDADTMACRTETPGPESDTHPCSPVPSRYCLCMVLPTGWTGRLPMGQARKWSFCDSCCCPWHTPLGSQHLAKEGHRSPLSSKLPFGSGQGSEGKRNSLPGQNLDLSQTFWVLDSTCPSCDLGVDLVTDSGRDKVACADFILFSIGIHHLHAPPPPPHKTVHTTHLLQTLKIASCHA